MSATHSVEGPRTGVFPGTIQVLIADDSAAVRAGLEHLLTGYPDIRVVGSAADGRRTVALALELAPDVVLMDIRMPLLDGIEATREIMANDPDRSILVLTSCSDQEQIKRALAAGAVGYMLKDAEINDLLAAIRTAATSMPRRPHAATGSSARA
jgi:DNA-binding NarL/FixJ family response regulator